MSNRLVRFGRWVESRRETADLSRPVGYADVLRYLFWRGMPALAGPVVALALQPLLYGVGGLVVFGSLAVLYLVAVLAGIAAVRRKPVHVGAFALAGVAATAGMFRWATAEEGSGLAGTVALFFGFTGLVVAGIGYVTVSRTVRE